MNRVDIYLDHLQDARLARLAQAAGTTKSAMIRQAIKSFIDRRSAAEDMREVLEATGGALPRLEVPSRREWEHR